MKGKVSNAMLKHKSIMMKKERLRKTTREEVKLI